MKRLNILLTFTSIDVLLVTIERFSFTSKILLQPYNFLRLHEVIQMAVIILITVILPFFILRELSKNFDLLKSKKGMLLGTIFLTGIYFYATGNGLHEVASFLFNTFCAASQKLMPLGHDTKYFTSPICASLFFNDYYTGNILYFIGAFLFTIVLVIFERMNPSKTFKKSDWTILGINSFMYALTIFAYAGFDKVLVGLWYGVITSFVLLYLLFSAKSKYRFLPYTVYSVSAYVAGTVFSLLVRFH